jgi:alpha/beta hydrolase fold
MRSTKTAGNRKFRSHRLFAGIHSVDAIRLRGEILKREGLFSMDFLPTERIGQTPVDYVPGEDGTKLAVRITGAKGTRTPVVDCARVRHGVEKVHVFGHCFGALQATLFAAGHPEMVMSLIQASSGLHTHAVDLALLDAFGRAFSQPVRLAEKTPGSNSLRYSGVVSADAGWTFAVSLLKLRLYGLKQVKLKVGEPT